MCFVDKVGQDQDRDLSGHVPDLPLDVVEGPLFRDVEHENDAVRAFVNVQELGVERGVESSGFIGQFEALQLDSFLALVHHVPDLHLDDVIRSFVVPLDVRDADLLGGDIVFFESTALE